MVVCSSCKSSWCWTVTIKCHTFAVVDFLRDFFDWFHITLISLGVCSFRFFSLWNYIFDCLRKTLALSKQQQKRKQTCHTTIPVFPALSQTLSFFYSMPNETYTKTVYHYSVWVSIVTLLVFVLCFIYIYMSARRPPQTKATKLFPN